jgi:hypothetical protein
LGLTRPLHVSLEDVYRKRVELLEIITADSVRREACTVALERRAMLAAL